MNAIKIQITGPRGAGKTTTAMRIVRLLRLLGYQSEYVGWSRCQTNEIRKVIDSNEPIGGCEPREFLVIDQDDSE